MSHKDVDAVKVMVRKELMPRRGFCSSVYFGASDAQKVEVCRGDRSWWRGSTTVVVKMVYKECWPTYRLTRTRRRSGLECWLGRRPVSPSVISPVLWNLNQLERRLTSMLVAWDL